MLHQLNAIISLTWNFVNLRSDVQSEKASDTLSPLMKSEIVLRCCSISLLTMSLPELPAAIRLNTLLKVWFATYSAGRFYRQMLHLVLFSGTGSWILRLGPNLAGSCGGDNYHQCVPSGTDALKYTGSRPVTDGAHLKIGLMDWTCGQSRYRSLQLNSTKIKFSP